MAKRVSLSILFFIRRTKLWKDGTAPIYVKLTYQKSFVEMALNRGIDPKLWDPNSGRALGKTKNAKQINLMINTIEFQLGEHIRFLREDGKEITPKAVKNSFLGLEEEKRTILQIFEEHNENIKKLIGIDFSADTYQKYEACRKHLADYIKKKYKQDDIELSQINHEFIMYLETFLKTTKKNNHNTAMKFLGNFKKIVRIAIANGWLKQDPFLNYKMSLKKVDRGFLTDDELQAIVDLKLEQGRLMSVRDAFLISCFTGLAYSDLKKLSKLNIVKGTDGKQWIKINRTKTDVKSSIPILPVVNNIIEKYKNHPTCQERNVLLPVLSNQKMNAYLKEVADLARIKKQLTTHLARHTFATTVTLNNDVPIETVSKMLGHSSINMTKTYARLLDKKVGKDMESLHQKYAS